MYDKNKILKIWYLSEVRSNIFIKDIKESYLLKLL